MSVIQIVNFEFDPSKTHATLEGTRFVGDNQDSAIAHIAFELGKIAGRKDVMTVDYPMSGMVRVQLIDHHDNEVVASGTSQIVNDEGKDKFD